MPRIALLSDIHANIIALEKVVLRLEKETPDFWICLGDFVGYGPFPSEVIDLVQSKEMICVKGNHDSGVTGELTINHFRQPNQTLIRKTQEILTSDQINWLRKLPYIINEDAFVAAHASPLTPEKWTYVESAFTAREIISGLNQKLCFVGHTHKPAIVSDSFSVRDFKSGYKYLINPGSVGQSRDGDYRASCAIVDTDKWEYKNIRVDFDLEPVLTGIMRLGFTRAEANQLMKT